MTKVTGFTKVPSTGFRKVKPGYDQAFTLQRGTSAAPIKQAKTFKKSKTVDAFVAGATGAMVHGEATKALKKKPITKKGWGKAYKRGKR